MTQTAFFRLDWNVSCGVETGPENHVTLLRARQARGATREKAGIICQILRVFGGFREFVWVIEFGEENTVGPKLTLHLLALGPHSCAMHYCGAFPSFPKPKAGGARAAPRWPFAGMPTVRYDPLRNG